MWRKKMGTSFFRFITSHTSDRQMDGRTASMFARGDYANHLQT